jgi:hypothetical protein
LLYLWKSSAIASGASDFCNCLFWFITFHKIRAPKGEGYSFRSRTPTPLPLFGRFVWQAHIETIKTKHSSCCQPIRPTAGETNNGVNLMISRRTVLRTLTVATLIGGAMPAFGKSSRPNPIKILDTDNDGTVDLAEVKKAASALFDKLDRDHDGTLDKRELAGRLNAKEFAAADPDHDGTLTKDEYLAVVEQRFNAASQDSDGTLDAKELVTKAGQSLMRLLK